MRAKMKCLDSELERIQKHKSWLQDNLLEIEQKRERERKRKQQEEAARILAAKRKSEEKAVAERAKRRKINEDNLEFERSQRGNACSKTLDNNDFVHKNFDKTVVSMACGGMCTVLLYEHGTWAFSSGLPKLLHNKLNGRQKSLPSPVYVSIGSQDRYYIKFADGKSEWVGCDGFTKALKKSNRTVKSVAFGETWESYFIVYTDGGWQHSNVPYSLEDLIKRRRNVADLTCVSLGPDGEYYVSARNGRAWWGGMNENNMATARAYKDRLKFMDFGDNGSFFIRY